MPQWTTSQPAGAPGPLWPPIWSLWACRMQRSSGDLSPRPLPFEHFLGKQQPTFWIVESQTQNKKIKLKVLNGFTILSLNKKEQYATQVIFSFIYSIFRWFFPPNCLECEYCVLLCLQCKFYSQLNCLLSACLFFNYLEEPQHLLWSENKALGTLETHR